MARITREPSKPTADRIISETLGFRAVLEDGQVRVVKITTPIWQKEVIVMSKERAERLVHCLTELLDAANNPTGE